MFFYICLSTSKKLFILISNNHLPICAFFTTKKEGMGMGLAICCSILEAHHGSIRAGNRVPQGAVMRVLLPPVTGGTS